jgi:hypothetical protein
MTNGGLTECSGCAETYVANVVGLPYWEKVGPSFSCYWICAGGDQGPASQKPWTTHTDLQYDPDIGRWTTGIFNGYYDPQHPWEGFYQSRDGSGCPAGVYELVHGTGDCPATITLY